LGRPLTVQPQVQLRQRDYCAYGVIHRYTLVQLHLDASVPPSEFLDERSKGRIDCDFRYKLKARQRGQ